jgi:glycosyltransferase involved in cell wall biosynthesis
MTRFTILLAAHNRLALLQQSIASALAEIGDQDEVLVIDDGSGEETRDWLAAEAQAQPGLRVIHQANQGVAAARANGVEAAEGEFIFILDSDDQVEAGALRKVADAFAAAPEIDLLYGNNLHVFPDGTEHLRRYQQYPNNQKFLRATFLSPRVPFKHSGTSFRRATALELGNYDASLPIKIDIDFFLKFMHRDRVLRHLDAPLVRFQVHGEMMSRNRAKGIAAWMLLIDRYGPRNRIARGYMKLCRAGSERLKGLYEKLKRR